MAAPKKFLTDFLFFPALLIVAAVWCVSCDRGTSRYSDESVGLSADVIIADPKNLVIKLYSPEGFGDGFVDIGGSARSLDFDRHADESGKAWPSATVTMKHSETPDRVTIEILRGQKAQKVDGKETPGKWWTSYVTLFLNPKTGDVIEAEFYGDKTPRPQP